MAGNQMERNRMHYLAHKTPTNIDALTTLRGASIIGGCCEITPTHIAKLKLNLLR